MVAESILHRRSPAPVGGERCAPVGAGGQESLAPRPGPPDTRAGGDRPHGVAAAVLESPPGRSARGWGGSLARKGPRMQICVCNTLSPFSTAFSSFTWGKRPRLSPET